MSDNLKDGISLIVPVYKGEKYISKLLDSIKNQTIDSNLFEVLFVINGERDNCENIINNFKDENPNFNIYIFESDKGVSNARNLGLQKLSMEYCIFIDADDYISYNYLEKLYKYRGPDRVVLGSFFDVDEEGNISKTYFTDVLLENSGLFNLFDFRISPLMITTNKLLPTVRAKEIKFNSDLNSAVDQDYFFNFYSVFDKIKFYIISKDEKAIYYRLISPNSLSRQKLSYNFNVIDRLKLMKSVDTSFYRFKNYSSKRILNHIFYGQTEFIIKYIKECPNDFERVLDEINNFNIKNFDYDSFYNRLKDLNLKISVNLNDWIDLKDQDNRNKSELNFYHKLLKTKPYRFAAFLRKIGMKLKGK